MKNKKGRLGKKLVIGTLSMSLIAMLATGCGSTGVESRGKIAVIGKAVGVQFWDDVEKGADQAGEELNYEIRYSESDTDSAVEQQIKFVQDAIDDNFDAIVIAPDDRSQLNEVLKSASDKGMKIITINSDITDVGCRKVYIGSSNSSAGTIAGREVMNISGLENTNVNIGIIGQGSTSAAALDRINGFKNQITSVNKARKDAAASSGIYSANVNLYNIISTEHCDNDRARAKEITQKMIEVHPEINLMFGTNENSTLGICDAISELGLGGKVKVVGFNSHSQEIEYIQKGILTGSVVQNPYNMGYLGVSYASRLLSGETTIATVDTGVMYVNASNLNDDAVQLLLHPGQDSASGSNS